MPIAILLILVSAVLMPGASTPSHAQECGDTLLKSATLTADLDCPTSDGLILSDGVTLDCNGHTIRGGHAPEQYGISVRNASDISVRNCTVEHFEIGIRLVGAGNTVLQSNVTRDNTRYGVEITQSSTEALIEGNDVLNNGDEGIHASGPSDRDAGHAIIGNLIDGNAHEGIYLLESNANTIADNDLRNQGKGGIYVKMSHRNVIDQNVLTGSPIQLVGGSRLNAVIGNSVMGSSVGISIEGDRNTVRENVLTGAALLGVIVQGTGNILSCNWVADNPIGLYFDTEATPNTVTMNSIVGNTIGLDATDLPPDAPPIDATDNWWGCTEGPGSPQCDSAAGTVDVSLPLSSEPPDTDGDGAGDLCDSCTDTDGDGFANPGFPASTCPVDNCLAISNPSQTDADSDGIGDVCDTCTDTDGDKLADPGFPASIDCLPVDNCPRAYNPGQTDFDSDGTGDACDTCPFDADDDSDGDGICGDVDPCPLDPDNDIDGDTLCGDIDNCPTDYNPNQEDSDIDSIGDACDTCTDTDGDGFSDPGLPTSTDCLPVDNCPAEYNPYQVDSDIDNTGDACDVCPFDADDDSDGDGICGDVDSCPLDPDNDIDGDTVCGDIDNCPAESNTTQTDSDFDGIGDACDSCTDTDDDGFANPGFPDSVGCLPVDNCPVIPNSDQLDDDRNGIGDVCECAAPTPGRCITGGGNKRTDCLVEFNTIGPVSLNRKRTRVRRLLSCSDGDRLCDRDGFVDGHCTFGVTVCLGNTDPRLEQRCEPSEIRSIEVRRPKADAVRPSIDRDNASRLEQALSTVGLGIRRQGEIVLAGSETPPEMNTCSPLVDLVVPAPRSTREKAIKRKLKVRGFAADGRRDRDLLVLKCAAAST